MSESRSRPGFLFGRRMRGRSRPPEKRSRGRSTRAATRSALSLVIVLSASCVKFTPPALDEPAAVLERFLICSSLEQTGDWAEPGPPQSVFQAGDDGQAFAFVGFIDLVGPHTLSWKWYDPSRRLYRAPDAIRIGEEGKSYESYIAWDTISVTRDKAAGVWTVAVFMDEEFLAAKSFEIRAPGSPIAHGGQAGLPGRGFSGTPVPPAREPAQHRTRSSRPAAGNPCPLVRRRPSNPHSSRPAE
jgi:hypothetical protein